MLEVWKLGWLSPLHILGVPGPSFWSTVREICFDMDLGNAPAAYILHLISMCRKGYKKSLLIHLLNGAKACIHTLWKQGSHPSVTQWFARVNETPQMERMTTLIHDTSDAHGHTWFY